MPTESGVSNLAVGVLFPKPWSFVVPNSLPPLSGMLELDQLGDAEGHVRQRREPSDQVVERRGGKVVVRVGIHGQVDGRHLFNVVSDEWGKPYNP